MSIDEGKISGIDFKDNNIEWLYGTNQVTASFTTRKYINRIIKLAEKYPDEVTYKENKDGSIICHFPLRYVKLTRPTEREMTEEQRRAAGERFAEYRRTHPVERITMANE